MNISKTSLFVFVARIVAVIAIAQVVFIARRIYDSHELDADRSSGNMTIRDAIDRFVMRTNTTGINNVHFGEPYPSTCDERYARVLDAIDRTMNAMGAARITVVRIEMGGGSGSGYTCIGPTACDAVTTESTCAKIIAVQKRSHPDVDVRCTDAREH